MSLKKLNRREFLRLAGINAAVLFAGRFKMPTLMDEPFMPDAEISITAVEKFVQILSGAQTRVWSYEGQLLSGSGVTVQSIPGSYLGPIIRAKT
ncbi:MAG TPA: hypothetical protein VFY83_07145, partial [Anaerolineales bacterium]|nr:hypothetical protein [Anaerolineales bacterium]